MIITKNHCLLTASLLPGSPAATSPFHWLKKYKKNDIITLLRENNILTRQKFKKSTN